MVMSRYNYIYSETHQGKDYGNGVGAAVKGYKSVTRLALPALTTTKNKC